MVGHCFPPISLLYTKPTSVSPQQKATPLHNNKKGFPPKKKRKRRKHMSRFSHSNVCLSPRNSNGLLPPTPQPPPNHPPTTPKPSPPTLPPSNHPQTLPPSPSLPLPHPPQTTPKPPPRDAAHPGRGLGAAGGRQRGALRGGGPKAHPAPAQDAEPRAPAKPRHRAAGVPWVSPARSPTFRGVFLRVFCFCSLILRLFLRFSAFGLICRCFFSGFFCVCSLFFFSFFFQWFRVFVL